MKGALLVVLLGAVALTVPGCAGNQREPGTEQLAADLAEVKAERDRLAAQVQELSAAGAAVAGDAVVDLEGCQGTVSAVRQRMSNAHDDLEAGKIKGDDGAQFDLEWAIEGLDDALNGDCGAASP